MNDITKVRRSKAPSALTWTHMTAGEFMIDLQDFFYSRHERIQMEHLSRNYADLNERSHKLYELIKNSLPEEGKCRHYLMELSVPTPEWKLKFKNMLIDTVLLMELNL